MSSLYRGDSTKGVLLLTNRRVIYEHLRVTNLVRATGEIGSVAFELDDVEKVFSDAWEPYWKRQIPFRPYFLGFQLPNRQRIWFRAAQPLPFRRMLKELIALGVITGR